MSDNKITLRKEQVQLIEKLAVMIEQKGIQPAMAKILALLTVNDDPEVTFDQIRETLGLSKSATSQALSQLLNANKIEYRTKLGDRKRYFCSRANSWQEDVRGEIEGIGKVSSILKEVLAQSPRKSTEFHQSMKKLIAFMDFLNKELPGVYQKFEDQYT